MKNSIVKLAALVMSILLAFTVAGCGGSGNNNGDSPSSGGSKGTDLSFFDDIPEELKGTTVKFATWIDHKSNESAQVLEDFTELTDINVELVNIPQLGYVTQVAALIASGEAPDVIVSINNDFPSSLQLLQPLNGIIDTTDTFWNQDIVKLGTIGDKSYLVNVKDGAWDLGANALVYYNARIFEENGITTPDLYKHEGRWTLDNFFKAAKELSKVCKTTGACVAYSAFANTYASGMVSYDADSQTFTSNLSDQNYISVMQKLTSARESGYLVCDDGGLRNYFINEEAGMLMISSYGLRKTGWLHSMDADDLAFIEMPALDAETEATAPAVLRGYGISKGASNAEGAAYFLRYFLDGNNYDEDELYLNEDAAEIYSKLALAADYSSVPWDGSVMNILATTSSPIYEFFPELFTTTSAQLPVVLNKSANQLESCILRANDIINKVKSGS